jgi:hypothetical protein
VPQPPVPGLLERRRLAGRLDLVLVVEAGLVVVDLDFEVRRGGVEEDHVDLDVEQVRDAEEDRLRGALRALQQEVHRDVQAIVGQLPDTRQHDLAGRPARRLELGRRRDRALADHREHLSLDLAPVAPRPGHTPQRPPDPELLPQRLHDVRAAPARAPR